MFPIALLTDFGSRDSFVATMKGVILSLAPKAPIIDLCHEIPPQDLRAAAFQLRTAEPYFPPASLFVCVVDPGVGSRRKIIWGENGRHQFLAPDNGLLSWLQRPIRRWRSVENKGLFLPKLSATFHGRDIFAPVAARLWLGLPPARLGPAMDRPIVLPFPKVEATAKGVRGEILYIDRFGNAITNLSHADIGDCRSVAFRGKSLGAPRSQYAQTERGRPLALFGSSGFLELSVRDSHFAKRFHARPGNRVDCR
ncbi:MAG: SAM-dependent chlorinase/fluorinase [Elusimicrobia bacterium]|nr:SAM-dependent chlorinase/fluorinase [Elusimicrobiota bacterium]